MTTQQRRWLLASGLVLLAIAAFTWWPNDPPAAAAAPAASPGGPSPVPIGGTTREAGSAALIADPAPDSTLPPPFEALRQHAMAGDARAGCQLATKLLYCGSVAVLVRPEVRERARQWEEASVARGDLEQANQNAEMQLASHRAARACPDIPEQSAQLGYHWMRQAALAGDPDAMLLHASGRTLVLGAQDGWSFLHDGRFLQWRQESAGMLQTLMDQRDPAAVLALLEGHTGSSYLNWITPPDAERERELSLLAGALFERPGGFMPRGFRWDDRQAFRQARQDARRLHAQQFDGATFELGAQRARLRSPSGLLNQDAGLPGHCGTDWSSR